LALANLWKESKLVAKKSKIPGIEVKIHLLAIKHFTIFMEFHLGFYCIRAPLTTCNECWANGKSWIHWLKSAKVQSQW
jgi:hypothetical protein